MDFGYTEEEEKFRERLCKFLDKELTEEIQRHLTLFHAGQSYVEKPLSQDKVIP